VIAPAAHGAGGRPPASVIVPFAGSDAELAALRERLGALAVRPGDEVIVSDNRGQAIHTPAHARNLAAAEAHCEWLVFLDADAAPDAGLLEAYFDPPPGPRTAVLAGAIADAAPPRAGLVARHALARGQMSHRRTLERAGTPYAQTANCAVRRSAFQEVGGFVDRARAGEDADLCFRLSRAGWELEERPAARVSHRPRATVRAWLCQLAVHGSGAQWLESRWPGEFPAPGALALAARVGRHLAQAAATLLRGRGEQAAFALLDAAGALAFELGRLRDNTRQRV